MKPETKNNIIGALFLTGVICLGIALMAMFGGCGHVGPAWKSDIANVREEQALADNDLYSRVRKLESDVADMRRGYRTIPVRVEITNAWEKTK